MASRSYRVAVAVALLSTLLAGCRGLQPSIVPSAALPQSHVEIALDRAGSWMDLAAEPDDLVYVSNQATQAVTVYNFWSGKLVGTLKGFKLPRGLCVDKRQDVYVVNSDKHTIEEYAHGGTAPIKTLEDKHSFPNACSVDPTTGDLAVGNVTSVSIYEGASGTPKVYKYPTFYEFGCAVYDNKGNLLLNGQNQAGVFKFAELAKGGSRIQSVTLRPRVVNSGCIEWDGKYLAVSNLGPVPTLIDQFSLSGREGSRKGKTILDGSDQGLSDFWFVAFGKRGTDAQANRMVAVDYVTNRLQYWNYPAGGAIIKNVTDGLAQPICVVVSKAER